MIKILNNLFIPRLIWREVRECDSAHDGTGYSPKATKHYKSIKEIDGESVKEGQFVLFIRFHGPHARMYISYTVSITSEKNAYSKAFEMIANIRTNLESLRHNRYYSGQSIIDILPENTRIFIIPKKNSRIVRPKLAGYVPGVHD